jgi:hypothetical protein
MIYGDSLVKWNKRGTDEKDPLGLNAYTYKPDINAIMQSGNLYVYCIGNPIRYADHSGEDISDNFKAGMNFMKQVFAQFPDFTQNTKTFITEFGKRIPDIVNDTIVGEIKNVAYQTLTSQLRGFIEIADKTGKQFVLMIREGATLSAPLIREIAKYGGEIVKVATNMASKSTSFFVLIDQRILDYFVNNGFGFGSQDLTV